MRGHGCISSVSQLDVSMPSTTVSSLLLFGFGTNYRLLLSPSIEAFKTRLQALRRLRRQFRHIHPVLCALSSTFLSAWDLSVASPALHAHLPCTTLLNSEERALLEERHSHNQVNCRVCALPTLKNRRLIMLQKRQTTGENSVTICMMHTCVIRRTKNYKTQLRRCNLQNILKTNIGCGLSRDT